ncbi:MAG: glycosyltransferase [bacterium]
MTPKNNKIIKVLYLITANTYGGAEHAVYKIVKHIDRKMFLPIVACLGNNPVFIDQIIENGVKIYPLNMRSVFDILVIPKLCLILKKEKIDIIHTQLFKSDFFGRIAGKIAGTRIIISTIQNMESFRRYKALNLIDRLTGLFNYKIISVSDIVRDFTISKTGLPPGKFITIYNFVDIDDYNSLKGLSSENRMRRKKLGLTEDNIVIGNIGRLAPQKSQKDFIIAASQVVKNFPQTRFVIAGEGPLLNDLSRLAEKLSLKGKIIFTGFIKDIREIFSIMDIFVLTSLWEGFPLTICEAMASYVPVVSTNVGGVPEMIEHGITGLLTEPGNIEQLKDAICKLIRDKDLSGRLARTARKRVEEKFSLKEILKQTERLYIEAARAGSII